MSIPQITDSGTYLDARMTIWGLYVERLLIRGWLVVFFKLRYAQ